MTKPQISLNEPDLIQCVDCGLYFDPSDLANVFAHEHQNPAIIENGKYIGKAIKDEQ